ncbi:MAG: V-type ATP synthase subunit F [Ruminococcaceae bacterium]|nr:V-type ATP synthase subunit F [Oscillospiraceae bacterium]
MYKIGVIGDAKKVLCFMAAGFCVYEAKDPTEGARMLKKAKNDGCAVIYVYPDLAAEMAEDIKKYADSTIPAIIPLPQKGGGYGITQLRGAVERAVGADIIFKEQ